MRRATVATEDAATAAGGAAKTASDTLKASNRNFYIEERPYVIGEAFDLTITAEKQSLHIVFRNAGRTPAIDFRIDPPGSSLLLDGKPLDKSTEEGIGGSNIASDATMSFDFPLTISERGKTMFEKEDKELIFKGRVLYNDVFGCEHQTQFCFAARARWGKTKICSATDGRNGVDANFCQQAVTPQ